MNTCIVIFLIAALVGVATFLLYAEWRTTSERDRRELPKCYTIDEFFTLHERRP